MTTQQEYEQMSAAEKKKRRLDELKVAPGHGLDVHGCVFL
jgi:hypothetical protein